MNAKAILIHCRRSPYGSSLSREAIDLGLAAAVFDQRVSLLFSGDAVWQLVGEQDGAAIDAKNQASLLQSLPLYDIETLYVAANDLNSRNLTLDDLTVAAQPVSDTDIPQLIQQANLVFNF